MRYQLLLATFTLGLCLGMQEQASKEGTDSIEPLPYWSLEMYARGLLIVKLHMTPQESVWWSKRLASASEKYQVPVERLIATIAVESTFDPDAKSGAGAIGSMQTIPHYFKGLAFNVYDPTDNINAGAYRLREYRDECGDWDCAAKAYNVGITAYKHGEKKESGDVYLKQIHSKLKQL